jgi:hypothetical protein
MSDWRYLELPPIGWQLFTLGSSQSDSTAFPLFLDTYATRLLAEPLIHEQLGALLFRIEASLLVRSFQAAAQFPCRL